MLKVTGEIRAAAKRLLGQLPTSAATRKALEDISVGRRKQIDPVWWRETYGDVDQKQLDKLARMADPARNANEHERRVAAAKLTSAKASRPPGMRSRPEPLPQNSSEWLQRRKNKTRPPVPTAPPPSSRLLMSDSVATPAAKQTSVGVARLNERTSDNVARLKALNDRRAARRAANRADLKCQSCGKPLTARRRTARYCNATCRSHAWRGGPPSAP